MPPRRLEQHPLTTFRRGPPTQFFVNGRPVPGFRDEPIAIALYARDRRILSRSMRYHRARGYFCGVGQCTHCLVRLNGVPNVRACEERCEPLAWVEHQNALPNADFDVLAAADLAFPNYLDAHRAFIRPKAFRPIYTRVIRGMAGYGRVPRTPVEQTYRHEVLTTDICVIGGGPAGLAAAEAASSTGLHVTLLERDEQLGGRLTQLPTPFHATAPEAPRTEGKAWAAQMRAKLEHNGVRIRTGTRLVGIYDGQRMAAATHTSLIDVRARSLVLATGGLDGYDPFPGSDRAGVLLVGGALRMLNEYGVVPGENVAIVGASREGLLLARDLLACGAHVATIIDEHEPPARPDPLQEDLRRLGVPIRWGTRPVGVAGRAEPRSLLLPDVRVPADCIVLAPGRWPAVELLQQAGCRIGHDALEGGFRPDVSDALETTVPHVYAAGSTVRIADEWTSHVSGQVAGHAALRGLSELVDEGPLRAAQAAYEAQLRRLGRRPLQVAA